MFDSYLKQGISLIPDVYGEKRPAISGWPKFCDSLPTKQDIENWEKNISKCNYSVCLGGASGLIAVDVDTTDIEILNIINTYLNPSPVVKIGSKGYTAFYKYNEEVNSSIKVGTELVAELLSRGKKTTIPPSIHPSGYQYKWLHEDLLQNKNKLPYLDYIGFIQISTEVGGLIKKSNFESTEGRNIRLSEYCSTLIRTGITLEKAILNLVDYDTQYNIKPLFSDASEMGCEDPVTNALHFYSSHIKSFNKNNYTKKEPYNKVYLNISTPLTCKKGLVVRDPLPTPTGLLFDLQQWIISNSFIEQPGFALSASLACLSTLVGRKINFNTLAPNIYALNIGTSGSGKDMPQRLVKQLLLSHKLNDLIGSGNYVSDASLMEQLPSIPSRLDIVDEASGLLSSIQRADTSYNSKMAEIYCELYTASTSKFMGRMTADSSGFYRKGECYRPNVNLLCSTTPKGFKQALSISSLEKGLLSRFCIFGEENNPVVKRPKEYCPLSSSASSMIKYWAEYMPTTIDMFLGIEQRVDSLKTSTEASILLDNCFIEFEDKRKNLKKDSSLLPVIARCFQYLSKFTILAACSDYKTCNPDLIITKQNVTFAYELTLHILSNVQDLIKYSLFTNKQHEKVLEILEIIRNNWGLSRKDLNKKAAHIRASERREILQDLLDTGLIYIDTITSNVFIQE